MKIITATIINVGEPKPSQSNPGTYQLLKFIGDDQKYYISYINSDAANREGWFPVMKVGVKLSNLTVLYGNIISADSQFHVAVAVCVDDNIQIDDLVIPLIEYRMNPNSAIRGIVKKIDSTPDGREAIVHWWNGNISNKLCVELVKIRKEI
jgi:hypothetical protein